MEQLVAEFGYPIIFLLTFLEGETVVIVAGFAAHRGWLVPGGVFVAAFFGSFLGDQLYFLLGRRFGPSLLRRFPAWRPAAERAFAMLYRFDIWFILGFRFAYGVRLVSPFIIGMSHVETRRFLLLNAIAALVWAASFTAIGYLFGEALQAVLGDLKHVERYVFAGLVVAAALGFLLHFVHRRRPGARAKREDPPT